MKRYLSGTLFFLLALGVAMPAFARISLHDMGRNQMQRIQQGIHTGELTRKEARSLRREQRDIRRTKRHFVRDGRMSRHERRVLRKRYARAGRHIYRLKHNHRTRYAHRYRPDTSWYNPRHDGYRFSFDYRF